MAGEISILYRADSSAFMADLAHSQRKLDEFYSKSLTTYGKLLIADNTARNSLDQVTTTSEDVFTKITLKSEKVEQEQTELLFLKLQEIGSIVEQFNNKKTEIDAKIGDLKAETFDLEEEGRLTAERAREIYREAEENHRFLIQQLNQELLTAKARVKNEITNIVNITNETVNNTTTQLQNVENNRKETENAVKRTEIESRMKLRHILLAIRATNDVLALMSAVSGESSRLQFLTLISVGISTVLQVQAQIAAYSANPSTWAIAIALMATLPMLTSVITYINMKQAESQQRLDADNQQRTNLLQDWVL